MSQSIHYVSGFFVHIAEVDDVFTKLIAKELPREQIKIYKSHPPARDHASVEDSNQVLKGVVTYGVVGAAVGTGIGVLTEVALIAANVTLFVASPLIAPLALLGWGASIGAVMGTSIGVTKDAKLLSALIEDAIKDGQIVLVVETRTDSERTIAQDLIKNSIGDYEYTE